MFLGRTIIAKLFLLGSAACFAQVSSVTSCVSYDPSVVRLTGTLIRKTFPGPPNFESIRGGDEPETYWLLNLPKPICVNQDNTEPDLNPMQENVRRVQLVLDPSVYKQYGNLVGKRITVTGTLFGAHTGHHHTPVLVTVKTLQKAK